ncbi:MAG TPA: hypothetical protein VFZ25_11690 [Chloroflexota bacterium]|nr:hypothetical protein [Chloroflexota bacterium]
MLRISRRRLLLGAAGAAAVGVLPTTPVFAAPRALTRDALGSILAGHRLVTYYGNPLSGAMGILGQLSKSDLVAAIQGRAAQYQAAGGKSTLGAVHMVVTVAQGSPGDDGLWRARMPASLIGEYADLAAANGLLFVADVQVGKSTVQDELAPLMQFLNRPNVHLALDPEFDMWGGQQPGVEIGHMTAAEINYAQNLLSNLASATGQQKILMIHQFAGLMLPDKGNIGTAPGVDLAIVMDGWGGQGIKIQHYDMFVRDSDIRFGGIKLFFDQDPDLMTASQALSLTPKPDVIIYQ